MSGISFRKEARDEKKKEKRQLKLQKRDARKQGTADKAITRNPDTTEINLAVVESRRRDGR